MCRFDIKENMKIKNGWLLIIAIVFILILFLVFELVMSYFSTFIELGKETSNWGTFGDFVGGILNPLLSFFGFCALIYTIHIQRKQIDYDKKDREIEKFDRVFFELFNLHNKTLSEVLESNKLQKETNQIWASLDLKSIQDSLKNAKLWKQYARNLYSLLKFIDNSSLKKNEICVYVSMIKALLIDSILELLLIEYTVDNNLKELIDKYALFQNAHFNKSNEILEASVLAGLIHTRVYEAKKLCDDKAFGL